MRKIVRNLLLNLKTDEYTSSHKLAEKVLISEKTVRTYFKELASIVEEYGASIESKHGYGYRLVLHDYQQFSKIYIDKDFEYDNEMILENSEDRCIYLLKNLISIEEPMEINDLLETLCISESTFQSDCKHLRRILLDFNLKLALKKGTISIKGDEFYKRILIVNYADYFHSQNIERLKKISELFLKVLNEHNISLSEISFNNMVQHLYTDVMRIESGRTIVSTENYFALGKNQELLSIEIAEEICKELSQEFCVEFSTYEIESIALHLYGHRVTEFSGISNNVVISQEIHDITSSILQFIYTSMKIDLRNHLGLIMNLSIHLVSLLVRVKYNIKLKNPLLGDIKKQYQLGYVLALQAKIYIDNAYQVNLNEAEVGYIALIFEMSLKNQKRVSKKNILIVCATGKTSSELIAYQYQEMFGIYLKEIKTCNISELSQQNFVAYDFIVSTTPIHISVPIPILQVKIMMTDSDEKALKEAFMKTKNERNNYFSEDLFFVDIEANNKNEAIEIICKEINKVINLPIGFSQAVLNREEYGSTDFGEHVALAHPFGLTTKETFVSITVLKEPVFWGKYKISIVFLLSICDEMEEELQSLYKKLSKLMLSKEKAKQLLDEPTFQNFLELIG